MRDHSRRANPQFVAFKRLSERALASAPGLRRLDCLNPVRAIGHDFDFSDAPEIDIESAWRRYLGVRFDDCVFSRGVRDSLHDIFSLLGDDGVVIDIPSDVYPVYAMIADDVGLRHRPYPTLPSFDAQALRSDAALIAAPSVPAGRDLHAEDVGALLAWLDESPDRLLIVDRVYDYDNSPVVQPLIDSGRCIVCYSLSKTFLSPLLMGMAIVPPRWATRLRRPPPGDADRAKVLLTRYGGFPRHQQDIFRYRWGRLKDACGLTPPETGYLAVVPANHGELLRDGILAIPGDVYGTGDDRSIVSCLHETNAHDDTAVVERFHVTVLSNFARGFDKYSRTYSKAAIPESTFPDRFFLLDGDLDFGLAKAGRLREKTVPGDRAIVLRTRVMNCELRPNLRTGVGSYVGRDWIEVDAVLDEDLRELQVEDAYADSLALNDLLPWPEVRPRSMSVLPIARACQARCDFCFSHTSVSEDHRQGQAYLDTLDDYCRRSLAAGAGRLVITGGGEPTLLPHDRLLEVMRIGRRHFRKVVMITNGYTLGHASESERRRRLADYEDAGLTVLAISRHGHDNNAEIMSLDTRSEAVAETWRGGGHSMQLRWICVLQRRGVRDEATLAAYLDWAAGTGAGQVCFKELYVAATRESAYSDSTYNAWCRRNQIPMRLVKDFLEHRQAVKVAELPWGSPIYALDWRGRTLDVAVYTEPSVFWERSRGICRSWNLLADGTCYASLETKDSVVDGPRGR